MEKVINYVTEFFGGLMSVMMAIIPVTILWYVLTGGDVWGMCTYSYEADSEAELMDKVNLGVGYSFNVWNNLYVDPNYTMPLQEDADGNREGSLNLSVSYKF